MSQYFPKAYNRFSVNVKVKLDPSYSARKLQVLTDYK